MGFIKKKFDPNRFCIDDVIDVLKVKVKKAKKKEKSKKKK